MSMTDPIADMLTRIRNACGSKHRRVDMPSSKMKIEIARLLKESNFIQDYQTLETEEGRPLLRIRLKYAMNGDKVIHTLDRQSKPGCRVYRKVDDLPKVLNGMGIAVVSTSKGVMSDRKAREANVGGELLCTVS